MILTLIAVIAVGILFLPPFPALTLSATLPQLPLADQAVKIRPANTNDINAITDIVVDAYAPAVHWKYIYQFKERCRDYHWECMREQLRRELFGFGREEIFEEVLERSGESEAREAWINVIDAPDESDDDEGIENTAGRGDENGAQNGSKKRRAVSLAVWQVLRRHNTSSHTSLSTSDLPFFAFHGLALPNPSLKSVPGVAQGSQSSGVNCSLHLDVNLTRFHNFAVQVASFQHTYIDTAYDTQLYLALLATHPDFDGRGYAATHLRWGKDLARTLAPRGESKEDGMNITLIATPAGWELYHTVGFEEARNLTWWKVGGGVGGWFEAMIWQPG